MNANRYRPVALGDSPATINEQPSGMFRVQPTRELAAFPPRLLDALIDGAVRHPERTVVARRAADGQWRRRSYADMLKRVRAIAQALHERNLSAERPLLILSGNSIEHLEIAFGAMWAGIPHCPLSPAASLRSRDYSKVDHAMRLLTPGAVFADDLPAFAPAIQATAPIEVDILGVHGELSDRPMTSINELAATPPGVMIDALHAATGPDTIAKFLFTSGSTGRPKAVTTTQRMLCANQQMLLQTFPFLADEPPVLVDWLPWSHTFGGSHNVGIALYNGGSLYIDDGKPTPELFGETIRNLKDIQPTLHLNVPRGWEELTGALESDAALRASFYARLKLKFFAAAGLSQSVWDRLDAIALAECGERIRVMAGLGATETAPASMFTTTADIGAGSVGLPAPGCELKLVPVDDKLEARFRGPHVMPGYWRDPEQTARAFDAEGYYRSGDALTFADRQNPEYGFVFDGRMAENFKLSSGSFVDTGALRRRVLNESARYVQDVVVTGADREEAGLLIFIHADACRELAHMALDTPSTQTLASERLHAYFAQLLQRVNRAATGSASRIGRACILAEPPSFDAGEITDKGSINQRRVLTCRAAVVEALYDGTAANQIAL